MQWERAIAAVDARSVRWWALAGIAAAFAVMSPVWWTPPLVDLGLGLCALGSLAGGWSAIRLKRRLAQLPLEIAPVACVGWVDGVRVYRFRVRLGRGRVLLLPAATVSFVDDEEERYALAAEVPGDEMLGPFVIRVADPAHQCTGEGRFELRVECESPGGERYAAVQVIPSAAVRPGRFGGIGSARGSVTFDVDWTAIVD
ncbi:MAG: hypothetical protein ABMA64_02125 [Myxococcota bacterium]